MTSTYLPVHIARNDVHRATHKWATPIQSNCSPLVSNDTGDSYKKVVVNVIYTRVTEFKSNYELAK